MRIFGLNRRRSENVLLILGQLILIAYVFQVGAFDHWNGHADVAFGAGGASPEARLHLDHCHGAPATCADGGTGFIQVTSDGLIRLPSNTPSLALTAAQAVLAPRDAIVSALPRPPRIAA